MLCEKCNHNQATVQYQQSINGKTTQYYLCEHCANEMQIATSFDNMLNDFLTDFANPMAFSKKLSAKPACPVCGMTYDKIKRSGRLGCSECYSTFSNELKGVLRNIHGTSEHRGKIPQRAGSELKLKRTITELKDELKRAINEERYEDAAGLRDRIKELDRGDKNE